LNDVDEIKRVLDEVDFLVIPSSAEGMPTVILEAMARSCAVIAYDVGAIAEMVSNENGILMKGQGINILYDSMIKGLTMNDPDLVNMKRMSRRKVEDCFLWEKVITDMKSIFTKLKHDNSLVTCSTE
jgi:glycosyltransferase involved in cell wall biosynthesis